MVNMSKTMKRCILYYPHIYDISEKWLRRTLLCWDEIGVLKFELWK